MTNDMIDTRQIEQHFDAANEAAEKSSRMARGAVIEAIEAGVHLSRAKESVPHGEWSTWLGKHWNYSQSLAIKYMLISNSECVTNLKEAKSINEALRMIADDKEEKTAPRAARKPATVVVSVPDDHIADSNKMGDEQPDPDPTPDPPTIRKTAKGSEKTPESDKPRTQQVPVETVDDDPESDPWEYMTFGEIIAVALSKLADEVQKKKAAKELRKAADKLDPPTKFVKPDLDEVSEYFRELKAVEPDSFFDFYESKGWLVGKVSMKDWRASARKWVRENKANRSNGNGQGRTATTGLNAHGRPPVVPASKINYK